MLCVTREQIPTKRRDALLAIETLMNNPEVLAQSCEKDALLDLALLGYAVSNEENLKKLGVHLNIDELKSDIQHTLANTAITRYKQ